MRSTELLELAREPILCVLQRRMAFLKECEAEADFFAPMAEAVDALSEGLVRVLFVLELLKLLPDVLAHAREFLRRVVPELFREGRVKEFVLGSQGALLCLVVLVRLAHGLKAAFEDAELLAKTLLFGVVVA